MTTPMYPAHRRSIVRAIALVLAVSGAGYVAGAFFHGTPPLRGGSAAEPHDPLPASGTVPSVYAIDWGRSDRERISQPRECDVANGISTACLFMD